MTRKAIQILGIEIDSIEKYIMDLCIEHKTVMKEKNGEIRVYPAHYYYLELNVARMLNELAIDCPMPEKYDRKKT